MDVRICQYTCRGRVCLPECAHNIEQLMSSGRPRPYTNDAIMNETDAALRRREIYKVTLAGSVVNIVLTLCKFAAGILGRSAAMVADAVHSLSDLATDVIVLVFVRISGKPEDKGHDYGHGKYETFATLLIGVALLVVGIGILWSGGERIYAFFRGETLGEPGWIALAAALVSIVSKEVLFQYTRKVGRKYDSPSVIANAWHHRSDAFSSIGTAAGIGGAILLGEDWRVLDPCGATHHRLGALGRRGVATAPPAHTAHRKPLRDRSAHPHGRQHAPARGTRPCHPHRAEVA